MIDFHAHLEMLTEPDEKIRAARDNGVEFILTIIDPTENWRQALQIVEKYEFVYFGAGVHPHNARLFNKNVEKLLDELLSHPKALAVGEVGLDYHYQHSLPQKQQEVFLAQAEIAFKKNKPLVIHSREAFVDTVALLDSCKAWELKVVFHCFSGGKKEAEEVLDRGGFISFAGNLTYPKAGTIREAALRVPPGRLLVETDCPFLTPQPKRGKKNQPVFVKYTYEFLADLKGLSFDELKDQTKRNFAVLFDLTSRQ
jgi:TatD DNase family protein